MTTATETLFPSLNARGVDAAEVARLFVAPSQFLELVSRQHALIVGPRGSGKTTLLKMLQPQALAAWQDPQSEGIRQQVDFTGVFIPTDRAWFSELNSMSGGTTRSDLGSTLSTAAFTTHLLRAWSETVARQIEQPAGDFRSIEVPRERESSLTRELSELWLLDHRASSLLTLKRSLGKRLAQIRMLSRQLRSLPEPQQVELVNEHPEVFLEPITLMSASLDTLEGFTDDPVERWALCFDELELSPIYIRDLLFKATRSVDSRLIFKLAISPFDASLGSRSRPDDPAADHDYIPIDLTYGYKEDAYKFSEQLITRLLEGERQDIDLRAMFGESIVESGRDYSSPAKSTYTTDSRIGKTIASLARIDPAFEEYLKKRSIDPENLDDVQGQQRASTLRKAQPIISIRHALLREGKTDREGKVGLPVKRSRKVLPIYSGVPAIYAMLEGNPRWIIGVVKNLVRESPASAIRFDPSVQFRTVDKSVDRFRALLGTFPVGDQIGDKGVLGLLDKIGEHFHSRLIDQDRFLAEPPNTFIVDDAVEKGIVEALGRALNAGAVVYIPDRESVDQHPVDKIQGKRFRLTYLFASRYRIAMRLDKPVKLSSILNQDETGSLLGINEAS